LLYGLVNAAPAGVGAPAFPTDIPPLLELLDIKVSRAATAGLRLVMCITPIACVTDVLDTTLELGFEEVGDQAVELAVDCVSHEHIELSVHRGDLVVHLRGDDLLDVQEHIRECAALDGRCQG
jgi:hypothetical protein